ncbi:peptide MFS transporter [Amycolatopsis regifaucium]|uniref:MFS transporter n=1 Tax=Amycolatopsis regifaucium TaxID=546365 RepID=A0A154MVJ2_9PSEU|nr:oligopeptide:H+ symporter [Amycolatopsis regifaucium]KZB88316.1 peptide permease [Amycolatopsis regifaucium]OKA11428.1 MFS transporter [Amycolatopsis regifaucium]SFH42068.1 proton-dependent oligopeptide transporter, POT family [Amycolatopsis regifaucium]
MVSPAEQALGDRTVTLFRMPDWYSRLFSADLLERFGFYGLQAVLVLYAAAPVSTGGLALGADAAALFGAWIAFTYMLSLAGGWLGDRVLGARRAMLTGCALSAAGFAALSAGLPAAAGLGLLAIGNAVFKPNHQAMVNLMFGDGRGRESGISLMFVATQVSSLLAPLACGWLGERVSWSAAFLACAAAMVLAGARIATAANRFGPIGLAPRAGLAPAERARLLRRTGLVLGVAAVATVCAALAGVLSVRTLVSAAAVLLLVATVTGFRSLHRNPELTGADRRRLTAFLTVFCGAALFWMIFAYSGSLLTLFARDHVRRDFAGFLVPASWMQSVIPLFTLLFAPLIARLLPRLGRRHNVAVKFAIGLCLIGAGFLTMAIAAGQTGGGAKVSPLWLVGAYLVSALGELVIAAVSIAATADVLPRTFTARMLGLYWLFAGLGSAIGAALLRLLQLIPEQYYYLGLGTVSVLTGLLFLRSRRRLTAALRHDPGEHEVPRPSEPPTASRTLQD